MRSLFFMLCLIFPILVHADEPIIIDNTDSGFSTNGTWHTSTNRPGYYGDNYVYANPGDPQKTATWNLGVSKGQYEIAIQWSAYTNRAINTEYIILNNGRQLAIAKVNQRIDGNKFNVFNTFNVKNGILTIVLSSATEGYVVADATRITKLPDLPVTASISKKDWTLEYADSMEFVGEDGNATNAFDDDASTVWHTEWKDTSPTHPHYIIINLGKKYNIGGLKYLPRQSSHNGRIAQYEFYTSLDKSNWGNPVATGIFENNTNEVIVTFDSVKAQYIQLKALSEVNERAWTSVAELGILAIGEQHEITITWDYPVDEPLAIGFDIRTNQNDGLLVSVPRDTREWTGMVDIMPGENVFDVRTKAMNTENSRWSDPAYYTPPTEPTGLSKPINFKATPL